MKCYYHPDQDAVGTCSQCGKAACRDCIEDIGGALLCKDCLAEARETAAVEQEAIAKKARRAITWSWILTVLGGLLAVSLIFEQMDASVIGKIGVSLFAIYAIWATLWGWKVVWPGWRRLADRIGYFRVANPLTRIVLIMLFFYIPLLGAYVYGLFGGGIYQYLKYRRITKEAP